MNERKNGSLIAAGQSIAAFLGCCLLLLPGAYFLWREHVKQHDWIPVTAKVLSRDEEFYETVTYRRGGTPPPPRGQPTSKTIDVTIEYSVNGEKKTYKFFWTVSPYADYDVKVMDGGKRVEYSKKKEKPLPSKKERRMLNGDDFIDQNILLQRAKTGDELKVRYDPQNPSDLVLDKEGHQTWGWKVVWGIEYLLMFLGVVSIVGFVYWIWELRTSKKQTENA